MPLTLHVDAARWRAHLSATLRAYPGLIPVAKGNGYGFGLDLLVAECARLHGSDGVDTIAVGTYAEAPVALAGVPGDVRVMEPYRPVIHADLPHLRSGQLVHTITHGPDLQDLQGRVGRPRVVVEGLSSMNRHGVPRPWLQPTLDGLGEDVDLVALSLHLPLGTGHLGEIRSWVEEFGLPRGHQWQVSHLTAAEQTTLETAYPDRRFRCRMGTQLWLGDPGALRIRGHVLDVRRVPTGDHARYRQRRLRAGWLLVVSGGTAQGVALEAPSGAETVRRRAVALAEGAMEAAGRVRSPFRVGGHAAWFVEPPHMQVSLLTLPEGATPPEVGDEIDVRVRNTTLHADAVVFE
ncbi:MAG: alanine racemase [Lapillicoccus sp.]